MPHARAGILAQHRNSVASMRTQFERRGATGAFLRDQTSKGRGARGRQLSR
jgi:hypothetical protein